MKKTVAFSALLFSLLLASCGSPTTVTVADFLLAANGVTVLCTAADLGDTGEVGGVTYTKRSKAQITKRVRSSMLGRSVRTRLTQRIEAVVNLTT